MSLHKTLNHELEMAGYLTLDQAYEIGRALGHKNKTVERELNPSKSPNVHTDKNEKHHIRGYQWIDNGADVPNMPLYAIEKTLTYLGTTKIYNEPQRANL